MSDIDPRLTLDHVEPITFSSFKVMERRQLELLVELPLLPACELLYDLNVSTIISSANCNQNADDDLPFITLNYDALSEENKRIADTQCKIIFSGGMVLASIVIEMPSDRSVLKIAQAALKVAEQFQHQSLSWAGLTREQIKEGVVNSGWIDPVLAGLTDVPLDERLAEFFLDPATGLYYGSQELLDKQR